MRDDDLQVLGQSGQRKGNKAWSIVTVCVAVACLLGIVGYMLIPKGDKKRNPEGLGETIDEELQQVADSLLTEELTTLNGLQGQVIVMEVQTGAIKALVGLERGFDGRYQPCRNFGYQQEPGSTVETAVLLSLLETGEVKMTDEVDVDNGIWALDELNIIKDHNWHRGGYGVLDMERALEVSSNIAFSKMVNKVFKGKELEFFDSLERMGFGEPRNVEGIEELVPMRYSSPKDSTWARKQLLWSSIGYDRFMTPIQTLTFYNAIANDGRMVKPTLRVGDPEVINDQIAGKENISALQGALYHVVSEGLAKPAGTPLVEVAGKTGTAQVRSIYGEGDNEVSEYHISFCGYFPAFAPKYSIIVSLNKQGLPASGGTMAGSVFSQVTEWMVKHGMLE